MISVRYETYILSFFKTFTSKLNFEVCYWIFFYVFCSSRIPFVQTGAETCRPLFGTYCLLALALRNFYRATPALTLGLVFLFYHVTDHIFSLPL